MNQPEIPADASHATPDPGTYAAWRLETPLATPMTAGHIHTTFRVDCACGRFALQRVNPIFGPEVNWNIDAVTAHLAARGLETPRLVRTIAGEPHHIAPDRSVWRLLTWVDGTCIERAPDPAACAAAGGTLGRLHGALASFAATLRTVRPPIHELARHLGALARARGAHTRHSAVDEIAPVADAILAHGARLEATAQAIANLPVRLVHGDPKLSNVIFDPAGNGRCFVDLDTFAWMPLPLELGDALRSWCCPQGEEVVGPFELPFAAAALQGYGLAAPCLLTAREQAAIPQATELIAVELAARFCADALEERYFGWDPARYPSRSAHNLARARAQLAVADSVLQQLPALAQAARDAFAGPSTH